MLFGRTKTSWPARSSSVAIFGEFGPVTTTSLTPVLDGAAKSTIFCRSGVTTIEAKATSPRPSIERQTQLVARHRHEHDVHAQVPCLMFLVQDLLELLERVVGDPALLPLVDEVVRLRVGRQHADPAPLDHPVEIPGPFLEDEVGRHRRRGRFRGRLRGFRRAGCAGFAGDWAEATEGQVESRVRPMSRRSFFCWCQITSWAWVDTS